MTVLTPEIETAAPSSSQHLLKELPREKLAWMLQRMCEIRYFEEKAEDLYVRGLVHGTMHLSIGQEAASVGSIATLRPEDLIIHHHRGHGHTIAKGANLTTMMAEFLGREAGLLPRTRRLDAHCRHPGRQPGRHGCRRRRNPHGGGHRAGAANAPLGSDPLVLLWRRSLERR